MFLLGGSSPVDLEKLLATALEQDLSYPEVGATSASVFPPGYRHDRRQVRIGDREVFDQAALGLRHWAAHEGAGIRIFPKNQPVTLRATVLVVVSLGPVQVIAPCRVVSIISEPDTFGFAYGTLPGHPERGEEAFVVERQSGGTFFNVRAFSKPAEAVVRLSGPLGRIAQRTATRRYIAALARYARGTETSVVADQPGDQSNRG